MIENGVLAAITGSHARSTERFADPMYTAVPGQHMQMFTHQRLTMAVRRFGDGPLPLLAFHGFDRTGQDFASIAPALDAHCTIHAFDLPFHGNSPAPAGKAPVSPGELADFITAYAEQVPAERVGLLGYSLGGRLALGLVEQCPQLMGSVFLAAPDGLVPRPWYRSMAHYRWGRWLYRRFIRHPGGTHALFSLLHRTGLLGDRMYHFLMGHTDTMEARALLHDTWTSFRLIEPDLERVAINIRTERMAVHLLLGEYDRVIKPAFAERLKRLAPNEVHVHLLPTGHRLLNAELGKVIAGLIG